MDMAESFKLLIDLDWAAIIYAALIIIAAYTMIRKGLESFFETIGRKAPWLERRAASEAYRKRVQESLDNLNKRNNEIMESLEDVRKNLENHIAESQEAKLQETRQSIINFAHSITSGGKYKRSTYEFYVEKIDAYNDYIEKNKIRNGIIQQAEHDIKRLYAYNIKNNEFVPEEYVSDDLDEKG